jgi:hypothetical protein
MDCFDRFFFGHCKQNAHEPREPPELCATEWFFEQLCNEV